MGLHILASVFARLCLVVSLRYGGFGSITLISVEYLISVVTGKDMMIHIVFRYFAIQIWSVSSLRRNLFYLYSKSKLY